MARYILSSRTLLDIIQHKGLSGEQWLRNISNRPDVQEGDICLSAVTPMNVERQLDKMVLALRAGEECGGFTLNDCATLQANLTRFVASLEKSERIVPISCAIARKWGVLMDQRIEFIDQENQTYDIGSAQKLEIATAIIGRNRITYKYVERKQPGFDGISDLSWEDPGLPVRQSA